MFSTWIKCFDDKYVDCMEMFLRWAIWPLCHYLVFAGRQEAVGYLIWKL